MAKGGTGNVVPSIVAAEHISPDGTGDNIEAKRAAIYGYDGGNSVWRRASVTSEGKLETTATISGDVTVEGAAAYSDSGGTDRQGLVDADRHVQVDVLTSSLPSGAATSAKQDTSNTSLASIDGKITAVNTGAVVVSSSALPTGASTSAKQDTIIGHLDGVEGLLTDIEADTDTLAVVGGGVEASALRVTIANDSTGVLSVDDNGSSLTVDNAGLTELAAAINSSKVDVNIVSSDIATGGTSAADDADFTAGTTPGTPSMGVYESTPTSVTDGDLGVVGITQGRRLKTSSIVESSALPTGASTSAKQDTIISHLDGVEGLLTTIDGDTGNISTKIDTLAGAVSGSEMQVDVLTMPTTAVTNAGLTELAAAINSDKLDVNIKSSDVATGGTSAADDADFTAGTTPGTPAMGVYESTPSSVTDGDLGTVGITQGRRLKTSATIDAALPAGTNNIGDVDVLSSALPSGASTSANQTTIIGHLDGVEGLLTTIDADTSNLSVVGGGTEAAAIRVTIANNSTGVLSVDDNGSSLTVDNAGLTKLDSGTAELTAFQGGSWSVDIGSAIPGGSNTIGKVEILTNTAKDGTGTDYQPIVDADGHLQVDVLSAPSTAVTNAGLTELAAAINSDKVDVNIASSGISFGGTSAADDADFTAGTTAGTPAMGVYESTPTNVTDGDLGTVGITQGRRLKTSATIDAALPAGTNAIGKLAANSGVDIGDVDVISSALPTGASTSAKQDTIIGHLDGVEGLLTTIAGDTTDIEAAVELIDDTVAVLGTDTYTEATSKGLIIGGVRRDADTTLVNTTNEFAPFQVDARGAVKVEAFSGETLPVSLTSTTITGSVAVTNAGTFATQVDGAALTALQLIDDIVYTDDTSTHATGTSKGAGIMAAAAPTDASVNANDIGMVAMTTDRKLHVSVQDAIPAGNNNIGDVDIASIAAGNNNIGDVDVATLPVAFNTGTRSATTQRVTVATDDLVPVTGTITAVTAITNALPAGTNAIGKLSANSGVDIGDVDVTSAVSATLDHGSNQDIDTAAEQITSTSFACKFGVTLRAPNDNTSILWIGNSDVTVGGTAATDGIPLYPGDSLFLPVSNSNIPYAIASANNQKIYWIAA